jgi:hypothetical protein
MPANLGNARMHWRKKNRMKKDYYASLDTLLAARKIRKPPSKVWEQATITVEMYVWSLMDLDNAFARLKWPLDWLSINGYIADDRIRNLHYSGFPEQEVDRKDQRLVITLEKGIQ